MKKNYGMDRAWFFAEGGGATIAIVVGFVLLAIALWMVWPESILLDIVLAVAVLIGIFIGYFFRDPNRQIVQKAGLVVAPGDGKVVTIIEEYEPVYLKESVLRVSIFLSVFDVHVQRTPIGGKVTLVDHRPGEFLQAYRPEASEVNEYIAMIIESDYGRVMVKQIAGILARRCVNYSQKGEVLKTGQRFGLIKFGSRVDLFLPLTSKIVVKVGDQVYGGLTPMAQLVSGGSDAE